jgi:Uma2 family endonuclease
VLAYGERKRRRKAGTMTTQEYLQTPETVLPCELAYGVMRVADAPSIAHQRMVGELFLALTAFVRPRRLGEVLLAPTDVVLDFDRALVVQPDLVFVSAERSHIAADRVYGAPDLAIEVLSPYARVGRVEEQVGWFAQYGVRECWLVDLAARRIAVLGLSERHGVSRRTLHGFGEPLASDVLAGFVAPVLYG